MVYYLVSFRDQIFKKERREGRKDGRKEGRKEERGGEGRKGNHRANYKKSQVKCSILRRGAGLPSFLQQTKVTQGKTRKQDCWQIQIQVLSSGRGGGFGAHQ